MQQHIIFKLADVELWFDRETVASAVSLFCDLFTLTSAWPVFLLKNVRVGSTLSSLPTNVCDVLRLLLYIPGKLGRLK